MRHLRSDYDPIRDPRPGGIGEDEPVFLLRAKDVAAPAAVMAWACMVQALGGDPELVRAAREWANEMGAWQASHIAKVPDAPRGSLRA